MISKDKYSYIFLSQMGITAFIILRFFFSQRLSVKERLTKLLSIKMIILECQNISCLLKTISSIQFINMFEAKTFRRT